MPASDVTEGYLIIPLCGLVTLVLVTLVIWVGEPWGWILYPAAVFGGFYGSWYVFEALRKRIAALVKKKKIYNPEERERPHRI
jgi:uncharacterized membrane protein